MFVGSHAPHKGHAQRFLGEWMCDLCLMCEEIVRLRRAHLVDFKKG